MANELSNVPTLRVTGLRDSRRECVKLMPTMIELFYVVFEPQIWNPRFIGIEILLIYQYLPCSLLQSIYIMAVSISKDHFAPILEITGISIQIFKSYVHVNIPY
jgi:hypothetical protein